MKIQCQLKQRLALFFFLFLAITFSHPFAQAQSNENPYLVFSLDQSFGNGIIHQQDMLSLSRIIRTLKVIQNHFPVYALLNPMNVDQNKVKAVINQLEQEGIPFIFDVYASDVLTIGAGNASVAVPFDLSHGLSLSTTQLQQYKSQYTMLKGLRIFEISSLDYTLRACRGQNPEWCEPRWFNSAANPFFDSNIARGYVQYARDHGLFVIWSDWHWNTFDSWDLPLGQQEQSLVNIMEQYPNTVITTYNNNEPNGQSRNRLSNWFTAVDKFSSSFGFGLSDQAWLCDQDHMNCPISDLVTWANSAITRNAKLIEFEPTWYFFKLPIGIVWDPANYTSDITWAKRGYPTQNLVTLAQQLGVTEPLPQPLLGDINNDDHVDRLDMAQAISDFGRTGTPGFIPADINVDGKVNVFDVGIVIAYFGM